VFEGVEEVPYLLCTLQVDGHEAGCRGCLWALESLRAQ